MRSLSALLLLWGLFTVYATFLPFDFDTDVARAVSRLPSPGAELARRHSRADLASNVLLFVPWGFLAAARWAAAGRSATGAWAAASASGLLLSAFVECGQLFLPSRTPSLADLAMNTAGAALGAWPGWLIVRRGQPLWWPALRRLVRVRPVAACTVAAALGFGVSGLAPFDIGVDPGALRQALKQARIVPFGALVRGPTPPADPWSWLQDALHWTLMGGLVALAVRETGRNGVAALWVTVLVCGGLAFTVEAAQLGIASRRADATSVVLAVIGATVGAAGPCLCRSDHPRRWVRPALAVWGLAVVLAAWAPFRLATPNVISLGAAQFVPFWSYYRQTDLNALADLFNQVASYVPAGFLIGAAGARRPLRAAVVWGAGLALVLEGGQLGLADRTADVSDVLAATGGAGLGAWFWLQGRAVLFSIATGVGQRA